MNLPQKWVVLIPTGEFQSCNNFPETKLIINMTSRKRWYEFRVVVY